MARLAQLDELNDHPITPLPHYPIPQFPSVILFDGVCNLCNGFVLFVIARDPQARFRFGSLQSEAAARLLQAFHDPGVVLDSVVLLEEGRLYTKSDAALRIARRLTFPWSLAYGFVAIPRLIRDWAYDVVASRRYQWFGKRDVCMVPTADLRSRFLSESRAGARPASPPE